MSTVNKVILIGNLAKKPESKAVGENTVTTFSLATSEKYKGEEQTEWHNIVMWGKVGQIAEQYLDKGSKVYLEGKIQTRSWEKEGVKHYRTEVIAFSMTMLGNKQERQAEPATAINAPIFDDDGNELF